MLGFHCAQHGPDGVILRYRSGWDGRPRPAPSRRTVENAHWRDTLDALTNTYRGPVVQRPLG